VPSANKDVTLLVGIHSVIFILFKLWALYLESLLFLDLLVEPLEMLGAGGEIY